MKIFIAIPCMESVNTSFLQSLLGLNMGDLGYPKYGISKSSLIYDARNMLAETALKSGADRIMWFDSDMTFEPEIIQKLSADLDEGRDFVSGLYFKRKNPIGPVVYKETGYLQDGDKVTPYAHCYEDYPDSQLFECAGVGFGAVMMNAQLIRDVYDAFGAPFAPQPGFGEDLSFCRRCTELGVKIWCDSRVKLGHVASTIITEESYKNGVTL